tara:strand:- start:17895 stop:19058 length:1164 start_codon:yes stop_codon:yes gene_type:complete
MDLERRLGEIRNFLKRHMPLAESEVLNHYPNPLPSPYWEWARELSMLSSEKLIKIENLDEFDGLSVDLKEYFLDLKELIKVPLKTPTGHTIPKELQVGMSEKKRHETSQIKSFLAPFKFNSFVDIGSGKGHLSKVLLHDLNGRSVCIDSDKTLQDSGHAQIKKLTPELENKITFKNQHFDLSSELEDRTATILGLHCCGDLSTALIETHKKSDGALLNFGCCYHKSTQLNLCDSSRKDPIELSFHALNLATRSNRLIDQETWRRRERVKIYRYILHMIQVDELGGEFESIGNAHHTDYDKSFREYVEIHAPRLSTLPLESLFETYMGSEKLKRLLSLEVIRSPLGRMVELFILFDRAQSLNDSGRSVEVFELFSRDLSPRNVAIFSQ